MFSKFSVKKPYTVLVGVVLVIVLGVVSFTKMTTDLMPNISLPYVIVMTTYPGASPETVEMTVTQPVEAGMATVSNIESISSVSNENYSMVILEFSQSTDMNAVSLEIRESLDQIAAYWDDSVGSPIIMKLNPDMLPVMIAAAGVEGMEHGDVSAYVKDSIVPALESIEGVASVSATGLLEESVNVIIRQDKINRVNEKIFAAIDREMQEAEEELDKGRQELEDSQAELADGRQEILDGEKELADGEKELEEGKQELTGKQDETKQKLAETKRDLLTAKSTLEAMKAPMTVNMATAKGLNDGIAQMNGLSTLVTDAPATYKNAAEILSAGTVSGSDISTPDQIAGARASIEALKKTYIEAFEALMKQMSATGGTGSGMGGMLQPVADSLKALDWTETSSFAIVQGILDEAAARLPIILRLAATEMQKQLDEITEGNYDKFVKDTSAAIKTLDDKLGAVNAGLVEVEKGQLTAAIEFANANAQIALGESQLEMVKKQLETAKEQMDGGEDQIKDALEQLEEGEDQLADAKTNAYEQADMNKILTVETVKGLLTAQNFSMPAGYVTEEGVDYLVRVGDKPSTVEELQALPLMDLHMDGVPVITLGDVADVFYTDNSNEIYTNVNGSPGVMLTIQKQTGYSTGEVSDLLLERFEELMEQNPDLTMLTLMDQGIYIDLVMDSILNNILLGAALAILILFVFLKDLRPTLVVAFSIPVSLVTAIVCMYFSGVTLNVISLSGLALGIGMLVDNSIVVIENIYRLRNEGYSAKEAAIEGAKEVAGAIVASTLTTICVFAPIVFTEGITRQLFVDMGLTIAYSLLASLLIALTVVPAMSSKLLGGSGETKDGKLFNAMTGLYIRLLRGALKIKPLVFVMVFALLGASIAAALSNGTAFMSDMDSTQLTVSVELAEDASLAETGEVTDQVVERILEIEDVEHVGAMTNSAAMLMSGGSGGSGNNATSVYVVTKEDKTMSNEEIGRLIQEKTADLEAEISVDTSSMDMSAMGGSGISIQVRGRNLDMLRTIATEVAAVVEGVEGTTEVNDGLADSDEELRVMIDRKKAVEYGLTVAQVFTQISARLAEASSATTLVAADKDYNVYVMSGTDMELTRRMVEDIEITGSGKDGEKKDFPLKDIAAFEPAYSLNSINRAEQSRYVSVSATIAEGYNVGQVANAVEAELAGYSLPEGYRLVFSGENEMIEDAMGQVMLMMILAVVFMYLIMVAQFQSLLSPFIILFTIPLAFTGGFFALFFGGSEVSVVAMIGFVMLAGVIVNNGIVLIDYINQLRESGMDREDAILTAGKTRIRPVLMTALTTILAMSTMMFSKDMGAEMAKPMALVSVGGLLYGTLLTLIVIPCVYDSFLGGIERHRDGRKA